MLQPGFRTSGDELASIVVRIDDGSTVATIDGPATIVDPTGCSALGIFSGGLAIDGEQIDLDGADARALSPDHRYVIAVDRSGDDPVHLLIDLERDERSELEPAANVFAVF